METLLKHLGLFLANVATMSAMTGKSKFIFYNPQMPKKLVEQTEKNVAK